MVTKPLSSIVTVRGFPLEVHIGMLLALALGWVYWPTLSELMARWGSDPRYSHGFLVPLFAAYLLWVRRGVLASAPVRPSWSGAPLLLAGLAMRFGGTYLYLDWLSAIALLPCVAGLVLLVGGWRAVRWSWPAVAFLVFMVPLPFQLEVALAHPLQRMATRASTFALQTIGMVAFSEGNVICMGEIRIGVVEACSGLSMLVSFFALSTAVSLLINRPWPVRLLIFVSAVPIALLANITRITVTGLLHKTVGSEVADYVFHDLAGWLMMPLALSLLWAELRLFAWVVVSTAADEREPMVFAWGRVGGAAPVRVKTPRGASVSPTAITALADKAAITSDSEGGPR